MALSAAFVYGHLAVTIVVRLTGRPQQRKYGFEFTTVALVLISSIALALVVLDAAWWDTWAMLPLVTVGALIVFAYRGYLRLTNRFGALQQLYDFCTVGEWALPRDHRNGLGGAGTGAIGHEVEPGGADHRRRMARGAARHIER